MKQLVMPVGVNKDSTDIGEERIWAIQLKFVNLLGYKKPKRLSGESFCSLEQSGCVLRIKSILNFQQAEYLLQRKHRRKEIKRNEARSSKNKCQISLGTRLRASSIL